MFERKDSFQEEILVCTGQQWETRTAYVHEIYYKNKIKIFIKCISDWFYLYF